MAQKAKSRVFSYVKRDRRNTFYLSYPDRLSEWLPSVGLIPTYGANLGKHTVHLATY